MGGKFTDGGIGMNDKIDKNLAIAVRRGMDEQEARKMAEPTIPILKQWKK